MSYLVRNERNRPLPGVPQWEIEQKTEPGPCLVGSSQIDRCQSLTLRTLIAFCEVNNRQWEHAGKYGEPGYECKAQGILFANWNEIPVKLKERLERQGYSLEWSDEWYIDGGRSPMKAYRTQPDGHCWESRIRLKHGDVLTPEDDAGDWIQDAIGDLERPLPSWFDAQELERRGFAVIATPQPGGLHPVQDSQAGKPVIQQIIQEGYEVVLQFTSDTQYDMRRKVWTRKSVRTYILFDECSIGAYPHRFAEEIDRSRVQWNGTQADWEVLAGDETHESFWTVWQSVVDNARLRMSDGTIMRLWHDGSVFYVDERAQFCEYDNTYYIHK